MPNKRHINNELERRSNWKRRIMIRLRILAGQEEAQQ